MTPVQVTVISHQLGDTVKGVYVKVICSPSYLFADGEDYSVGIIFTRLLSVHASRKDKSKLAGVTKASLDVETDVAVTVTVCV